MPQLQTLVLTDRAATPVAHTFVPRDIVSGVGTVVESSGVPIGNSTLSASLTKTASNRYKATVKFAVPVVATQVVNGISTPVIVRTSYADVTFTFDSASSETERNNFVGMFADAFGATKTLVNDVVVKLQGVY